MYRAKNVSQLKTKLPELRSVTKSLESLKPVYDYAFNLFRDRGTPHKLMKFEVASRIPRPAYIVVVWGQLITPAVYPHAEQWKEYLGQYQKDAPVKKAIGLDVWKMLFDFVEITARSDSILDKILEEGTEDTGSG